MSISSIEKAISADWPIFTAKQLTNPKFIWKNSKSRFFVNASQAEVDKFLKSYSYKISKDDNCCVDISGLEASQFIAERYGGEGLGYNGGGSRCGNKDGLQLKGIGANLLVGKRSDKLHSYGGLDIYAAVLEVINSSVYNTLLPNGTVAIHALIYSGDNDGFDITRNESCPSVIMIRDISIRPAHLMRNLNYTKQEDSALDFNDIARVRRIHKSLHKNIGGRQFLNEIAMFLMNNAKQFAFARVAGIMHGVITPSNSTLDGKWIDLNTSGLVDSSINYCIKSSSYYENKLILEYALRLLYDYSKYNKVFTRPEILIDYYNEQFYYHFIQFSGYVFGIDEISPLLFNEWKKVADIYYKLINANDQIRFERPSSNLTSKVKGLIVGAFLSLVDEAAASIHLSECNLSVEEIYCLTKSFSAVVEHITKNSNSNEKCISKKGYALTAIKRVNVSQVFFIKNMESDVRSTLLKSHLNAQSLINEYIEISKWAFSPVNDCIYIFKSLGLNVGFINSTQNYFVEHKEAKVEFSDFLSLMAFVDKIDKSYIKIRDISLESIFFDLKRLMPILEKRSQVN